MWNCAKCSKVKLEEYFERCPSCGQPRPGFWRAWKQKSRLRSIGGKARSSNADTRKQAVEEALEPMIRVRRGPVAGMDEAEVAITRGLGDISPAIAELTTAARAESDKTRRDCLIVLVSNIGNAAAISFLVDVLRDELTRNPAETRNVISLVEGLVKLRVHDAIPLLQEALRKEPDRWRMERILSLVDQLDPSAGDSERPRSRALAACSTVCYSSDQASARKAAAELLDLRKQLTYEQRDVLVEALTKALKATDYEARARFEVVGEVLVGLGTQAIETVRSALRGDFKTPGLTYNEKLAAAAARALGKSKDRNNVPELQRALDNPQYAADRDVRTAILEAIHLLDPAAGTKASNAIGDRLVKEAARVAVERERQQAEERAAVEARLAEFEHMGREELVDILRGICSRWASGTSGDKAMNARATAIGEVLASRGGIAEMRRAHAALGGMRGARTLEMHWDGIDDWRG